jgi:ATP-dependent Clp protease ATP-binding subunit ClpA
VLLGLTKRRDGRCEGRVIDFKNTFDLLTSRCGSELIRICASDPRPDARAQGIATSAAGPLLKVFPQRCLGGW